MATTLFSERKTHFNRKRIVLAAIIGLVVLVGAAVVMMLNMSYVPADLDLSTTQASQAKVFRASYTGAEDPLPINKLHSWTLHVETVDGQPVTDAEITVDGDMPQHGHGLPTQPLVTQNLGNGDYLVEGMKFQMGGWWVIDFKISVTGRTDQVSFNLMLTK